MVYTYIDSRAEVIFCKQLSTANNTITQLIETENTRHIIPIAWLFQITMPVDK